MYLYIEIHQSVGAAPVQTVPVEFVPNRLLLPPSPLSIYPTQSDFSHIDREANRFEFKQHQFNSDGDIDTDANDFAIEMVLHVRPEPACRINIGGPVVVHALHRGHFQTARAHDLTSQ